MNLATALHFQAKVDANGYGHTIKDDTEHVHEISAWEAQESSSIDRNYDHTHDVIIPDKDEEKLKGWEEYSKPTENDRSDMEKLTVHDTEQQLKSTMDIYQQEREEELDRAREPSPPSDVQADLERDDSWNVSERPDEDDIDASELEQFLFGDCGPPSTVS